MMGRFLWACLLAILAGTAARAADVGPNLLTNGDFETGPWNADEDPRAAQADLMTSHSGVQSARLTARPDAERYVYGPAVDVDPNKSYVLVAWIKTQGLTDPGGVHIRVLQWSEKEPVGWVWNWEIGQGVKELIRTGGTHEWRRFAAVMTKLDPRTKRLTPFLAIAAGQGTAWFDDLTAREAGEASLPPELAQPLEEPGTPAPPHREPPEAGLPPAFDPARLACPPRQVSGPSTLANGDFEKQPPAEWLKTVKLDTEVKHGGSASLALGVTESGMIAGAKEVDADLDYRLSVWVRTENVPEKGLELRLWPGWWNEATMSETLIVAGGTRDWTRYEITLDNLPPTLNGKRWWLYYSLKGGEKGKPEPKAWIDDAEIVPLADSVRVTSARLGNFLLEGEDTSLSYTVRALPAAAKRRVRWATTDFWGRVIETTQADLAPDANGTARLRLPMPGRGYHRVALVLEDSEAHPIEAEVVSAAVLPPPASDANRVRPESVFACWGVNPELAPLLGVKWTRWVERSTYFLPVADKPNEFEWTLKQWSGEYRPHAEREAEQRGGLMTYLCFHQFADWLRKGPDGSLAPVPRDWSRFADWVAFVYQQVADVVPVVEVWNEPVIPWGWQGTPEDIVTLHRTVYQTVKRVNPQVIVIGPCDSTEHLDAFGRLGGFRWVDAVSIHPYRRSSPEATAFAAELQQVKEITARYGKPKDLWITEMGWTTAPGRFTELEQANWMVRAYLVALSQGVRNLNVHIFADWNNSSASEKYYGIVRTDRTPKPAAVAYATMTRNLEGVKFVRAIEGLGRASYGFVFERNGEPVVALWNAGAEEVPATLRVDAREVTVERLDGNAERVTTRNGELSLKLGQSPLFVHGGSKALLTGAR